MLTAVCLNPCIDRTVAVRELIPGGLNRVSSARSDAGGKGVNVAVTAARLGLEAACASFLPGENSRILENRLTAEGVRSFSVPLPGALRTNLKIFDESKREITEVNESGARVSDADLDAMTALIEKLAAESEFMVFSGSLPPACPASFYRTLMERIASLPCRCILDADGDRLREGLRAKPYLIKPNLFELEDLTGEKLASLNGIRRAADRLVKGGVGIVAVSMGGDGAFITDGEGAFFAPRMNVVVRSTVGAGDAMLAGLAAGLHKNAPLEDVFRMGVAAASAAVMSEGTQPIDREICAALMNDAAIERL